MSKIHILQAPPHAFLAVVPLLMGLLVMFGWIAHSPFVFRIIPEFVAMVFNTALCFVICSFAIIAPHINIKNYSRLQTACGIALITLSSLVLIETLFSVNLGVDWQLLHAWLTDENPHPGRMAPNTAVGFILCGLILILINRTSQINRAEKWIPILTISLIIVGITGLIGYFLKMEFLYSWYQHTRMALTTAVAMIMLGIAFWLSWRHADWFKMRYIRKQDELISANAAVILIIIALTTGLVSFVTLENRVEESFGESIALVLKNRTELFTQIIEDRLTRASFSTNRPFLVHALRKASTKTNQSDISFEANELLRTFIPQGFTGLAAYDMRGREITSTGRFIEISQLETKLNLPYEASLHWHNGFYLKTRLKITDKGDELGYIIAEQSLPSLTSIMFSATGLGKTEESGLCVPSSTQRRIDCFPQRANQQPYSVPYEIKGKPLPVSYALEGKTGIVKTKDYRGNNVIAAYTPLGKLGPAMVMKVDMAELYTPIREQLQLLIPILLVLITLGSILLRSQIKPLVTQIVESEKQAHDISKSLEEEKLHIQSIVEHVADSIVTLDEDGTIASINPAAERMFGFSKKEVVGQNIVILMPEDTRAKYKKELRRYLDFAETYIEAKGNIELPGRRKDGALIQMEVNLTEMHSSGKRLFVGIMRDVTARKIAEQRMAYLAQYDSLTSLPNRYLFNDQLQRAMARSARTRQLIALMYLDIDYFKNINDAMGHDMGDALLKSFAARLKESVRGTDTVARLGGDEFTIILEGLHNAADATVVAQKIIDKMKTGFFLENHYLLVTTSIGIALTLGAEMSAELLIKKADQALYRAKKNGRSTYALSE